MFERFNKEGVTIKDAIRYSKNDAEVKAAALDYYNYRQLQQADSAGGDGHTTELHEAAVRNILLSKCKIKLRPVYFDNNPENEDTAVYDFAVALRNEETEESQ